MDTLISKIDVDNIDMEEIKKQAEILRAGETVIFPTETVYIAVDGKYAGDLVISDEIKADSKEAIAKLKQIGIKQTVMLTGDNKKVADAVAAELKLDKVYSNLLSCQFFYKFHPTINLFLNKSYIFIS